MYESYFSLREPAFSTTPDSRFLWLSTATGEPVLNRAVRDTSAYVEVAPPLMSGQAYFWFIDALMDDGGVARSSVWRFTIPE